MNVLIFTMKNLNRSNKKFSFNIFVFIFFVVPMSGCDNEIRFVINDDIDRKSSEEIMQIMENLEAHWNNGELELMKDYYSENVVQMPPNHPHIYGRENLLKRWILYRQNFNDSWMPYIEALSISGDLAVMQGGFKQTSSLKQEKTGIATDAKSIVIFKRNEHGKWQITHDIWNINEPKRKIIIQ